MDKRLVRRLVPLAVALALAGGCSGGGQDGRSTDDASSDGSTGPSVTQSSPGEAPGSSANGPDTTSDQDADLAEPTEFEGRVRVVNLYAEADGTTITVDLWARRSFTNRPVLLAEAIEAGEWSDYAEPPVGQSLVVVRSGEGSDAEELGGIFSPSKGEQITGLLIWESGEMFGAPEPGPYIGTTWERSPEERPDVEAPPAEDMSLLTVNALPIRSHESSFTDTYGGTSFHVGDGSGACLAQQRTEAEGFSPAVLGGTNVTVHDLEPGTATVTFHRWPGDTDCAEEPILGPFEVELKPGNMVMLALWSPDGRTIEPLVVPID